MSRKRIRIDKAIYDRPGATFHVIVQTQRKKMIFVDSRYARLIHGNLLSKRLKSMVDLIAFVVMPDHVHLLIGIKNKGLVDVMNSWKTFTTNLLHKNGYKGQVWQRSFWDRGMRGEKDVRKTVDYIMSNPSRLTLITGKTKYPFSWCIPAYDK